MAGCIIGTNVEQREGVGREDYCHSTNVPLCSDAQFSPSFRNAQTALPLRNLPYRDRRRLSSTLPSGPLCRSLGGSLAFLSASDGFCENDRSAAHTFLAVVALAEFREIARRLARPIGTWRYGRIVVAGPVSPRIISTFAASKGLTAALPAAKITRGRVPIGSKPSPTQRSTRAITRRRCSFGKEPL